MGAILNGANRTGANLSGADFTDAEITQSDSQEAWAWSDEPPTGLPGSMMRKIVFCILMFPSTNDGIILRCAQLLSPSSIIQQRSFCHLQPHHDLQSRG